ncbi:MAG: aminoglycoside phosphotransferase family protein [Pseudomonadota bacterium]|nr:MAG: aminoglycoside phosphotransferase family protein [Pseudomonadota bacterium]
MSTPRDIAQQFDLRTPLADVRPWGAGLINDTFLVCTAARPAGDTILQRINPAVFPQPALIMHNLRTLLAHVQARQAQAGAAALDLQFPAIRTTHANEDYVVDEHGALWRAIEFIQDTRTLERVGSARQAQALGHALGRFHALVHDLDPASLHDTLPGFHITPRYLTRYDAVAKEATHAPHSVDLDDCMAFIEARRSLAAVLEDARHAGRLSLRVVHGDPKLNNFLFDSRREHVLSLIDLDTVKPGLVHHDIGDCLRSCCNTAGESPGDAGAVRFDLGTCRAVLGAWFEQTSGFTSSADLGHLYDAIRLIPFELGLRFVTDHLEGDHYFRVVRRGDNLRRAMVQFRLTASIEDQQQQIANVITEVART